MLRKGDIILAAAAVSAAVVLFFCLFYGRKAGKRVVVYEDNSVLCEYSLFENAEFTVNTHRGSNTLKIEDGSVTVTDADCPDRYCVSHVKISGEGETIVCLPHRLVIKIEE